MGIKVRVVGHRQTSHGKVAIIKGQNGRTYTGPGKLKKGSTGNISNHSSQVRSSKVGPFINGREKRR